MEASLGGVATRRGAIPNRDHLYAFDMGGDPQLGLVVVGHLHTGVPKLAAHDWSLAVGPSGSQRGAAGGVQPVVCCVVGSSAVAVRVVHTESETRSCLIQGRMTMLLVARQFQRRGPVLVPVQSLHGRRDPTRGRLWCSIVNRSLRCRIVNSACLNLPWGSSVISAFEPRWCPSLGYPGQ